VEIIVVKTFGNVSRGDGLNWFWLFSEKFP